MILILQQPPKPPLDSLLEVGGSGRENESMWPLDTFDGVVSTSDNTCVWWQQMSWTSRLLHGHFVILLVLALILVSVAFLGQLWCNSSPTLNFVICNQWYNYCAMLYVVDLESAHSKILLFLWAKSWRFHFVTCRLGEIFQNKYQLEEMGWTHFLGRSTLWIQQIRIWYLFASPVLIVTLMDW